MEAAHKAQGSQRNETRALVRKLFDRIKRARIVKLRNNGIASIRTYIHRTKKQLARARHCRQSALRSLAQTKRNEKKTINYGLLFYSTIYIPLSARLSKNLFYRSRSRRKSNARCLFAGGGEVWTGAFDAHEMKEGLRETRKGSRDIDGVYRNWDCVAPEFFFGCL